MIASTYVITLIGLLGACSQVGPTPPQRPPAVPSQLGSSGSKLLEFDSVIIRLTASEKIGDSYVQGRHDGEIRWNNTTSQTREFNVLATDELRANGYRVSEPADRLFAEGEAKRTRYRLGAVLRGLQFNRFNQSSFSNKGKAEASVDVEFQLYDSLEDRVIYSRRFSGYALDEGINPNPINAAVLDALRYMLEDREFVGLASADATEGDKSRAESRPPLVVPRCELAEAISLPNDMNFMLESVIRIRVPTGAGAGVIVSPAGHVLTSAHVVSGLEEVQAQLRSGLELDARVLRVDTAQDIALIQLPGRRFRCAPVSVTPALEPGADVFSVGSPLGELLNWSVSRGVVSGLREFEGRSFVQTDVSVNPGNSGGPLFDSDARVVGVVSFKAVGVGVEGIGFGVPISAAQKTLGLRFD